MKRIIVILLTALSFSSTASQFKGLESFNNASQQFAQEQYYTLNSQLEIVRNLQQNVTSKFLSNYDLMRQSREEISGILSGEVPVPSVASERFYSTMSALEELNKQIAIYQEQVSGILYQMKIIESQSYNYSGD